MEMNRLHSIIKDEPMTETETELNANANDNANANANDGHDKKKSIKKYINKAMKENKVALNIQLQSVLKKLGELEGMINKHGIKKSKGKGKGKDNLSNEKRKKNAYNIFLEVQIPIARSFAPEMTHKEHFTFSARYWSYMKNMKKNGDEDNIIGFEDYIRKGNAENM